MYAVLNQFVTGHGYFVDAAIEAAIISLQHNRKLAYLKCPSSSSPHLDMHARALDLHSVHTCGACGKEWELPGVQVQGNPLADLGLRLVGNELYCSRLPSGGS